MRIEDRVRQFILNELRWDRPAEELTDDFPLIDNEVVDSLGIFTIISFIETEYDLEVADEELVPEHFVTVTAVADLIRSKRSAAAV